MQNINKYLWIGHSEDDACDHHIKTQAELDNIIYVVQNWGDATSVKHIEDPVERDRTAKFRRENKIGHKHRKKYHLESVTLPSGVTRTVLRRIENKTVDRIVVSCESLLEHFPMATPEAPHCPNYGQMPVPYHGYTSVLSTTHLT